MNAAPVNILIVDDNKADVRLFSNFFKREQRKINFFYASDGEEALNFLYKKGVHSQDPTPSLVILDINIPKINGIQILKEVKQDENLKIIPIIIMTSSENREDILACYQNGANCVLIKEIEVERVIHMFKQIEEFWVYTASLLD